MAIVFSLLTLFSVVFNAASSNKTHRLPVLLLLPYPDHNGRYGWDRGLELLPAARVAVSEINSNNDILADYELELIERPSDACGRPLITGGLENLVANALSPFENDTHAIAVIGLACSTVAATISPIAGRFDLLQLSMANSDLLRDKQSYPHLWRLLPSSVLVQATMKFMEKYQWRRSGLIYDENGLFFQSLATTFRKEVHIRNFALVVDMGIVNGSESSVPFIVSILDQIQSEGVRIIFAATTIPKSVEIMCQAAKKNLVWPGYVWIFPSRTYEEFTTNAKSCSEKELFIQSLENVILVDPDTSGRENDDILISGLTYKQYRKKYDLAYHQVQREFSMHNFDLNSSYNNYANPMYDQVWALALAINSSIPELNIGNQKLYEYQYNMPEITEVIERYLKNVSFSGALTNVYFNEFNEISTAVNIFQIRNFVSVQIGRYKDQNLTVWNIRAEDLPADDFVRRHNTLPLVFFVEVCVNGICLFICTSILLVILLVLKKEPEVLAISPLLSMLIFFGCYQLTLASILGVTKSHLETTREWFIFLCYLNFWSAQSGINFITTTVLIRLIRIHRIFNHFGNLSSVWKDKYLFFVILLIACLPDLVTIIGVFVDPLQLTEKHTEKVTENPPVTVISSKCRSDHNIIYIFNNVYTGLLILMLLIYAILTRKVGRKNFKDTKKVAIFVFCFTIGTTVSSVLYNLFQSTDNENAAVITLSYSYQAMTLLCLVLLIIPKTFPALYYRFYSKKKRIFHAQAEKDTTISQLIVSGLNLLKP